MRKMTALGRGDKVRVIEFGDDYGRVGVVTGRVADTVVVDFVCKTEWFTVDKLEAI